MVAEVRNVLLWTLPATAMTVAVVVVDVEVLEVLLTELGAAPLMAAADVKMREELLVKVLGMRLVVVDIEVLVTKLLVVDVEILEVLLTELGIATLLAADDIEMREELLVEVLADDIEMREELLVEVLGMRLVVVDVEVVPTKVLPTRLLAVETEVLLTELSIAPVLAAADVKMREELLVEILGMRLVVVDVEVLVTKLLVVDVEVLKVLLTELGATILLAAEDVEVRGVLLVAVLAGATAPETVDIEELEPPLEKVLGTRPVVVDVEVLIVVVDAKLGDVAPIKVLEVILVEVDATGLVAIEVLEVLVRLEVEAIDDLCATSTLEGVVDRRVLDVRATKPAAVDGEVL
ncbi:hypothetical protein MMC07_001310 [Pseudocyphellaria aurata]|nr:hypothetical protein [Pseudocyphellaria aurata]